MLDYVRTDVSEGIDFNKTKDLHKYIACYYNYIFGRNFNF